MFIKSTIQKVGRFEFVCLMATLISIMAMSIDSVLPALSYIFIDFNLDNQNSSQYVIGFVLLGFAFGQIFYGPISDSLGRKNTCYIGYLFFIIGTLICIFSQNFNQIILGRILQGFGGAAFRVCSTALVRDMYSGTDMAKIMSIVMSVFVLVPVFAPSVGQLILFFGNWRFIFVFLIIFTTTGVLWMSFRLQETLKPENKRSLSFLGVLNSFKFVLTNKNAMIYTACSGFAFSGLIGYINSSQQILQNIFHTGNMFSIYFSISAISIGISSFVNSMIVKKYGMRKISNFAILTIVFTSMIFLLIYIILSRNISLLMFMIYIMIIFFCFGLLFGNFSALAMQHMCSLAGTASSVIGSISSIISVIIGTIIGQSFNNTILPICIGFLTLSLFSLVLQLFLTKQ